uniref:Retinitis pigmentosa 1 homolog like 1 n=1 Tax=Jaculus jaculus TaxID=51337 RepID=A0A8C5KAZ3_JACJA
MTSTPGDANDTQSPSHRQCLLPSVAPTPSVTEVTPAKKITFLKRGDPQFAGVRLAVHQRTFKTFSALMDELSRRVPLSFGVRSVTTPRGLHSLSALEQLQDGGCYFCSDKRLSKTPRGPERPLRRNPSTVPSRGFEGGREEPGTASSWKAPTAQRRMTLLKNGDPTCQQTVVLSHRNTRNLAAFLRKASDLLHFPVKQAYTTSGKKVDTLQTLLQGPSVLVCAGNEAFRHPAVENNQGNRMDALSGVTARSKTGLGGPRARQSVIHSRSRTGGRLQLSERSGLGDCLASGHHDWVGPATDSCPQDTPAAPGALMVGDDVEKKVCMNEDGSLSVEMKVRFQLLGEDALRWSQRAGHNSVLTAASRAGRVLEEAHPLCYRQEGHPWGFLEPRAQGLGPCEVGCQRVFDRGQQQPGSSYDIWRNPLATSQGERPAPRRRWGLAQLAHCRGRWIQGFDVRKRYDKDSSNPASNPGHPENIQASSHCPQSPEGGVGSDSPCPTSSAASRSEAELETGKGLCPKEPGPGAQDMERTRSDTSASAGSHEESSEWGDGHQSCLSQARAAASQGKATHIDSPHVPLLRPSSVSHMVVPLNKHGQGTRSCQDRGGPGQSLPVVPGHCTSCDAVGTAYPTLTATPSQRGKRRQKRPASAVCIPVHCCVAQRGHDGQCHQCRDTHCSLASPEALQVPRPPEKGRVCSRGPDPQCPKNSSRARNQASRDPGSPSSSSFDSQDLPTASRATIPHMSNTDHASGSNCSTESAGATEHRAHSSAPTLAHTDGAGGLGDKAGGNPESPSSSALLGGCPEAGEPGVHQDGCRSQLAASSILGTPSGQTQAPFSEACWVGSSYCPTPPGERPCAKKHPSSSGSTSSGQQRVDDNARPRRVLLGKSPGARESFEEQEEDDGGMTPYALPSASPDAVVREWLDNIPEEPVLMTYETAGETTEVAGDETKDSEEDPRNDGELAQARQQLLEGDTGLHPDPAEVLPVTGDALPKSGDGPHQDADPGDVSQDPAEAKGREGTSVVGDVSPRVLPNKVSVSTQIMKALLGSKQGRPSSLPEVSGTVAQRLSHSTRALITCLARLHFFDEDLGLLAGKMRLEDSPRYQELLSISQSMWPGNGLGQGRLDLGLGRLTSHQALLGSENFTPTSSSGVDVSSGSGGSGEGSVPCAVDTILVPERMEPPLTTSSQRPTFKTQGHPEVSSCSTESSNSQVRARAPSREETERGGTEQEQMLDNVLEHSGMMQEEEEQLEEREEIGRERPQEEGLGEESFPEKVEVSSRELLGAGSQDGEGSPEDKEVLKEETEPSELCPPGQGEEPTKPPYHLSERDSNATGCQSGPRLAPGLEELPRAAGMGCEQTQTSTFTVHKVSLDPDAIWVSKLLRKMEKAFMAHLASATAELRARWSLQNNGLLDQMVVELVQDVGLRLQASTDKELRKIQSRAGRTVPGPPREALRGQTSLQTEQRRRRLQGLRNFSAFPGLGPLSLTLEDGPAYGAALGTRPGGGTTGDDFCPCDVCMKKKLASMSSKDTAVATSAPIRKAFDLRQILQSKKAGCGAGVEAGLSPEKTGILLQGADRAQELQPAPQAGEELEETGGQRSSRAEDTGFQEAERGGYHEPENEKEGGTHPCLAHATQDAWQLEEGVTKTEGPLSQGSGDGGASESIGQEDDNSRSVESQEAAGEGQPEAEGGIQCEQENAPQVSLGERPRGDVLANSSLDQEGRLRTPHRRPGSQAQAAARDFSNASSLSNCSLVSQKGSEKDCPSRDLKDIGVKDSGVLHTERKVTTMYPESSTSEQEGTLSGPRTPEQETGEGCDVRGERFACVQTRVRADGFDQHDLDF